MADIYDVAEEFRRQMLASERRAAGEMVRAYGQAWLSIRDQLRHLERQIARAQDAGRIVTPAWLYQQSRLELLQQQTEAEIRRFARYAEGNILAQQREAVEAAQEHAQQLALAGLGEPPPGVIVAWTRLPREAVSDLVGFLSDGSPLSELLDELGPEASASIRRELVAGVATGQGPRVIARRIRRALGENLVRALRISRTEVLRSYREASRRSYRANRDIVTGWVWHSARDERTCLACVMMHGTTHTLDERLDDHPGGRCSMVPITKSWRELGYEGVPETRAEISSGREWFERQPDDVQRRMLGPAKHAAWKDGKFALEDLVGRRRSTRWGTTRYERSLQALVGHEEAAQYIRRAVEAR